MKIYVASSWRNTHQPGVVQYLRGLGHAVYDFREHGFSWDQVDPDWERWGARQYYHIGLQHELCEEAFQKDFSAMEWADTMVLVLPCGRSAHMEAGWSRGRGKPTCIYVPDPDEPLDVMHKMAKVVFNLDELREWINVSAPALVTES